MTIEEPNTVTQNFLSGGGKMGELIRTMDWSKSSLGNPDQWSQSLRTSVSICLNSRFPLLIWWGNDLVKIYNDAYRELIAEKHPKAMGAKGADVWPEIWHILGPMLQGVLDTGEATWSEDEQLIIQRNGYREECYFTYSHSAIRDETGEIGGVFCAINETTKKVLTERHLAKQLNNLLIQAPVAICILHGENYVIEVINERMAEMWDRKMEDVLNKPAFDVLPELRDQGFKELLDNVYNKGERFVAQELPINLNRNGKIENAFVKFIYEPLREENGTISGVMALAHEITEQVVARKKIEESEAFNRTVLESNPDCVKVLDAEGRLIFMNSNGLCNMEIDDFSLFKNEHWWNLWGEENRQLVKDAVTKALSGETAYFQALGSTVKGTPKWWDVIVSPVLEKGDTKKISHIISSSRDITEQKKEAIKLEESEHRYHNMIYSSLSAIGILQGADLIITTANEAMIEILGKGNDIIGKRYFDVMPELIEQGYKEVYQEVYTTGNTFFANETPVNIFRSGKMELRYYNFSLQAQRNAHDEVVGIGIIASEVTSQARFNLQLKESEERFHSLADNIPMMAFIIEPNAEATISYWNQTWLNYTGQTFKEALDRAWYGIIHPDDVPVVLDVYVSAFEKRESYFLPAIRVKRYDGKYRWHMIKSNPRYLPDGEFMGYIGVGFDIHESKLAEDALKESELHFRQMSDLMPAKITNANVEGGITYCNKNWLDYTGISFEELKNFGYHNIIHPDELETFQNLFQKAAQTGTDLEMEMRFMNKDGEYIWHLNRASPVKDENGYIKMWIGVTTEIQKMKEEGKLKDNFLSIASHELKTPVTTIKAYGQIAEMMLQKNGDVETLGMVNRMGTQVNKLNNLIVDLLDFTKIRNGKLIYNEAFFDLNAFVKEVIGDMQSTSTTHKIENMAGGSVQIFGDRDKLSQVLNNLISNAIKYSPKADKIIVSTRLQKDGINLRIQDFGIGISAGAQNRVFEQFYRVTADNLTTFPGMGIGLYISSEIIKRHGGKIWVESIDDKGSVFCIWLPFDHRNNIVK